VRATGRSPQGPSSIWTMHHANPIHHAQICVDICPCSSACMALVLGYLTCLSNNSETVWSIALHRICFYLLVKEKLLKLAIFKQQNRNKLEVYFQDVHILDTYFSFVPWQTYRQTCTRSACSDRKHFTVFLNCFGTSFETVITFLKV